jgi:hypothetical protein
MLTKAGVRGLILLLPAGLLICFALATGPVSPVVASRAPASATWDTQGRTKLARLRAMTAQKRQATRNISGISQWGPSSNASSAQAVVYARGTVNARTGGPGTAPVPAASAIPSLIAACEIPASLATT